MRVPRAAVCIWRAAAASLRAYVTRSTPEYVAGKMFKGDVITAEILKAATREAEKMFSRDVVLRAANAPAEIAAAGWAQEIARVAIFDMIQSITSISAASGASTAIS